MIMGRIVAIALAAVVSRGAICGESGLEPPADAKTQATRSPIDRVLGDGRLRLSGYGVLNAYFYDWQSIPDLKNEFDIERFVLEAEYFPIPELEFEAAVEFEHGGTGSALEFERFEEFGEFEQEVEKGGEVVLEELYAAYTVNPWLGVRFGKIYVNVGPTNRLHLPRDYFTNARPEMERSLIPVTWQSPGIEVFGQLNSVIREADGLAYSLQLVSALDSTGFSDSNWVAGGEQTKFETTVLEDIALAGYLEHYQSLPGLTLGLSFYHGNSSGNRPRDDLSDDAYVSIFTFHAHYMSGPLVARGTLLYGTLQNSEAVTEANKNLSNNLHAPRTPVGSAALGYSLEAGYDIAPLLLSGAMPRHRLIPYLRYEFYDSMYRTKGSVFDNPRFERMVWSVGVNFDLFGEILFKASYVRRESGASTDNVDSEFVVGIGASF